MPRREGGVLCALHECRVLGCRGCVFGEKGGLMGNRFCHGHTCQMMFCLNPVARDGALFCGGHGGDGETRESVRQMGFRTKSVTPVGVQGRSRGSVL